jgi:uncharacterized delta-60 repeat protein
MWRSAWWGTIFFISLNGSLFGQTNGSLDTTFNKTGKFIYQIAPRQDFARSTAVAVTAERIYLLGIYSANGSDGIGILALKRDGTLDDTFDGDGTQTVPISRYDDVGDIEVQGDGKILICGFTEEDIFVMRLNPDGSMDDSWGIDGVVITSVTTSWDRVHKIKCQPDGKVVAAGYCGINGNDLVVVRYNANGTLDPAFGTGGKFTFDFNGLSDRIEGLSLQPDGKIVVSGSATIIGESYKGFVMRLTTHGVLDPTFNTTGIVTLAEEVQGVAVRSDGKILCASDNNVEGGVYAFNQNGSSDASFGTNGFASSGMPMAAIDIACEADGNFYMFGYSYGAPSRDFVAVSYQPDGSLQTCFGNTGISKFDVGSLVDEWGDKDNTEDYLYKGVLQPDGKLLLAGDNQRNEYVLTRVTNAGPSLIVQSNAEICQGDKYPFGSELLTAAGVYQRTLTSEDGCGAREILKLSVRPAYNHQVNLSICPGESIVFDGKVLSSADTYVAHLHSIAGCDSVVTLNLSINAVYELSVDRTVCQGASVVFGSKTLTTAGTYTNRFSTIHGCDSIVTLNLSINAAYALSVNRTVCQGASVVFGSKTLTTSGTYTNRFSTIHGCDSIVTLNLSINAAYAISVDRTVCQGTSFVFGSQTLTTSGTYTNRFSTIHGCDSIVTLNLSINPVYELSVDRTVCQGASFIFGSQILTTSGTYTNRFSTIHGCDSIVHLSLLLLVVDIDNRINQNDNILTAVEPNASYQWIDSEGLAIPGQNDQQFRPDESGTYSVRVEKNGCSVISEGISLIIPGMEETEAESVYPNPSHNQVVLTLPEFRNPVSVLLKDVNGRAIRIWNNVEVYSGAQLELRGIAAGVYFLQVDDQQGTFLTRMVKVDQGL